MTFIILFILILGGSYLYWRYSSIARKKDFFASHLVLSLAGNITLLLVAIFVVNIIAPQEVLPTEPFTFNKSDTTFEGLSSKTIREHYALIHYICKNELEESVTEHYSRFIDRGDSLKVSVGQLAFGIIAYYNRSMDHAIEHFNLVPIKNLPLLNFSLGKTYLATNDTVTAIDYFKKELEIEDGAHEYALENLASIYNDESNYTELGTLLTVYPDASVYFPQSSRKAYWHMGDFGNYILWTYRSIYLRTPLAGIVAATLIAIVWLIYLAGLNAFDSRRPVKVALLFICGVIYIPIIFIFNDFKDANLDWALTDAFWNDLFYSILMIGVPEEFTKAIPILLFLLFGGSFQEPIDYVIGGAASALGFAFLENILYFNELDSGIIHGRAYLSVIGHMLDSSLVAYGIVIALFKRKSNRALLYMVPISFIAASITHGIYDWLLFQNLVFFFLIFFIFSVQVWIIIINNCLNNSPGFSYARVHHFDRSRLFITFALTAIFVVEYLIVAFTSGSLTAQDEFYNNILFAGLMIIFFSSNLSSFDLVQGYWRDVYFSSRERRGYGTIPQNSVFVRWYLVNSIHPHNYVGMRIAISNDPYNKTLAEYLAEPIVGTIVNRLILEEDKDKDPHWFLVQLESPILFPADSNVCVLVKLRYQSNSLINQQEVQAFFKAIPDMALLQGNPMKKDTFPFYGWVYLSRL